MSNLNPKSVTKPITKTEASYQVNAVATYYPDFTKVYVPNTPYHKLRPGLEAVNKKESSSGMPTDDSKRSLRRTKKTVRDYVLSNRFELFATFTFKDNRQDPDGCKMRMQNWLKNQNKRKGKFNYLIVPEFHKDKVSLHFHSLISGYNGKIEPAINPMTNKPIKQHGDQIYVFPSYTLGFNNVKVIEYSSDSQLKLARYISKYITKDMPLFANKNRYWTSHGLKLPRTEDNPADWYKIIMPERTFEIEHGKFLYFNNSDLEGLI